MFALGLLTFIVLRAFSAQAKVVDSFDECKQFFYKDTKPQGMDQNAKKICQMYEQGGFYYATLYSVHHRIPLYSAYTLDPECTSNAGRTNDWYIEPQISQPQSRTDHMVLERDSDENIIKGNQAISSDYSESGYDRGHLNPNSFQSDEGRTATCTLTNAAPMDACFNRIHWKSWESTLRSLLLQKLDRDGDSATAYIVTGTVPSATERIPHRGSSRDAERVTVPSHIWTAVCYKHDNNRKSFSFGYMGRNQPVGGVSLMRVSDLDNRLSELYSQLSGTRQTIRIFADDCFVLKNELEMIQKSFQKLINLPVNQGVQLSPDAQNTLGAVKRASSSNSMSSKTKVRVKTVTAVLAFDSMYNYYTVTEDLKAFSGSACLLTHAKPLFIHNELRKREVSEGSDAVECLLVPVKQKTAADGSPCSSFYEGYFRCICNTEFKPKPCCSTLCLYQEKLKGYRCYSGQKLIKCSPQYSLITYKGDRCKDEHPCATYGEDYYWCNTISGSWDYCSPPLWRSRAKNGQYCRSNHTCAKYGYKYTWCYTDDKNNHDQCCTSDDHYSAVNNQTCRPDHPCGFYGKNHLWCHTTDGNQGYCCTSHDCTFTAQNKTCRSDHPCGFYGEKYMWCYTDEKNNWDYCCKN